MNRKIFMKFNVLTAALLVTAVLSASPVAAQDFALGTVVGAPGELWEINLTTLATSFLTDTLLNNAANQPNAQAWDDVNKRFYYAKALGGNLYVWEQATDTHTFLGNLESLSSMTNDGNGATPALASAAFYNGEYYFVVDGTDDLWKVTFSGPLAISAVTFVGDLTGNHHVFFFGDIAINSSGVLYGSGALQVPIVEVQFFSYVLGSLDPLSRIINANYGNWLVYAGRHEDARQQFRRTLELDSGWAIGHLWLGQHYMLSGSFNEAIPHLERAAELSDAPFGLGELGLAYARSGRVDEAHALVERLNELAESRYVPPLEWASVYAGLGDLDNSFEWLDKASDERSSFLPLYRFRAAGRILEQDPRFSDLMRRSGLEE